MKPKSTSGLEFRVSPPPTVSMASVTSKVGSGYGRVAVGEERTQAACLALSSPGRDGLRRECACGRREPATLEPKARGQWYAA